MATKDIPAQDTITDDELALTETIRVAVPERSVRHDLRAVSIVWRRELIRFRTDRLRAITSLVQPVLFLFVLGTGLSRLASHGLPTGVDFKTFIYPGVLAMSVLFTSIFSAASIVWDREFGFLREMLVAPVRRWAIVVGKCLAAPRWPPSRASSSSPWPAWPTCPTTRCCCSPWSGSCCCCRSR